MTHTFDAIICGGGLAGSAAGFSLARRGHSVAILDRANFPRKKLCGGLLTWKSVALLEHLFTETPESLSRAGAINYSSDRYTINTFSHTLVNGSLPYPFYFADRTTLDALLLSHAEKAGATIIQGTKVTSCTPETGTVTCANGDTYQGAFVIGADGANSIVRKSFPSINRDRMKQFMAPTIEISLDAAHFPRPVTHPELYVGFMDTGYGWVFPNQNRVVLGICGLRSKKYNFSRLFKEYLEFLEIDPTSVSDQRGHPLPYGNYVTNPVYRTALLAGDAGGFVEPLFGEGIFYALCTGMYAGESVAHGLSANINPGPVYSRRLHQHIIPEIKASDRLRRTLFKGMELIGPPVLKAFVNAASTPLAEMVHGMRSYSWLRRKQWDFHPPCIP